METLFRDYAPKGVQFYYLYKALEELVGLVENPTTVSDLNLKIAPPPEVAPKGVVPRIEVSQRLVPVKIRSKPDRQPFYAKLRAEVAPSVLSTGNGTLYLGLNGADLSAYYVDFPGMIIPLSR